MSDKPTENSSKLGRGPTEWPPSFPQHFKDLLLRYFSLLSSTESHSAVEIANEIFATTGCLITPTSTYDGAEEIAKAEHKWNEISVYRRVFHLSRVYSFDDSFRDIVILGQYEGTTAKGARVFDFTCRAVLDEKSVEQSKLALFQMWLDTTPMIEALKVDLRAVQAKKEEPGCCVMS